MGWFKPVIQEIPVFYSRILGLGPIQAKYTQIAHNYCNQFEATYIDNFMCGFHKGK